MKICIDARMAFSSGIGMYIRETLSFLNVKNMHITLLVSKKIDLPFEQIHFPAPIYSIKEQILFPFYIPSCDIFWSPHYNVPLLPIRAKKRIATIHDVCHLVHGSSLQKTYARLLMSTALKRSERIITVSKFSKSEIIRLFGKRSIDCIPSAANQKSFTRRLRSETVRKKYQLPKKFALFVGNYKPHKNLANLEKAFKKVGVEGLELVLIGKGTKRGMIDEADLPTLYSMADVFIFPSLYEGFGLPPLEAMCCGCPTAVSNYASMPEVCGDAALYFDPNNIDEMANVIRTVATDPQVKKYLIEKGYERAKMFSWRKCAEQHAKLFQEVYGA